ncbi:Hypothetical predicted protein [Octopus vulgaris]|uniref:Uncharacterized protein n=1 Tax=Octopus vulgaris TaxID=6645 RepID=A0AA36B2W0_OCTVU|nr:Hypothetical predicted protein [Octopus vulgaris]
MEEEKDNEIRKREKKSREVEKLGAKKYTFTWTKWQLGVIIKLKEYKAQAAAIHRESVEYVDTTNPFQKKFGNIFLFPTVFRHKSYENAYFK